MNLTTRQLEVLRLAAEGHTNGETGRILFISEQTVKTHRESILRRLNARNMTHAFLLALREGYLLELIWPPADQDFSPIS